MICAARESGAKRTEKGIAGLSSLNLVSLRQPGCLRRRTLLPRVHRDKREDFFMREKKFGKLFLTWLLAATMVLTLLPVSMLAMDAPGEAEDGEVVLAPVAWKRKRPPLWRLRPCCWPHPRQRTRRLLFPRVS